MLRVLPLALVLAACAMPAPSAQTPTAPGGSYSATERAQGYALRGESVVFVYEDALYGRDPERVVVTGAFRGWSADMDDPAWVLTQEGASGVWSLEVPNPDLSAVAASAPFKFRVDAGVWLDPPEAATNVQGGNLVFMDGVTPPRLVAELRGERSVWVDLAGDGLSRPTSESAYTIVRWDGARIPVADAIPNGASTAVLVPAEPLATDQVHYVEARVPGVEAPVRGMARFDGLWRDMADARPLGAIATPEATTFRLFAPRADAVHLFLYRDETGPVRDEIAMERTANGVWEHVASGDLHGVWYDYGVMGPDGPGSHFTNQTGETVSDPYALVSDDSWGRARIWRDEFAPPQPVRGGRPAMEDVVAYEVHVQDFTDNLPVPENVGPLEAFAMPGLTNARGEPIGLDFLARLGVNAVHLMPIQEYLHYPDSVWQEAFADDPFMQAQGIAEENYQWGYRTTHPFAVESRFRSAADEPGRERERFRDLVDALHARGMAVLVDVVFNHTGENMEGTQQLLTFNGIDKHYYYRLDENGEHIGAFGNEVKSENRPMAQRWLLEQLQHYVDAFGVDGFRIDLAGQTDEQTLRWIQAELGEDVLIYGEPWIGSNDPDYEANPDWDWYKVDSPITFFQDDARNALKGPTSDPTPEASSRGFAGGDAASREDAMRAIANAYPEEPTPTAGINYLDIHDNWALADRFASTASGENAWDGRAGVREAEMRIAAALLLGSLGPVVIHGGTEIAKSKGLAPLPEELGGERVVNTSMTPIYLKGRGDTYNLRAANRYDWEHVGQASGAVDYAQMEAWWSGLIQLRLSDAGAPLRIGTEVPEGYVRFFAPEAHPEALGWMVDGKLLFLTNAGSSDAWFDLSGIEGEWRLAGGSDEENSFFFPSDSPQPEELGRGVHSVDPKGVLIWVRQ